MSADGQNEDAHGSDVACAAPCDVERRGDAENGEARNQTAQRRRGNQVDRASRAQDYEHARHRDCHEQGSQVA